MEPLVYTKTDIHNALRVVLDHEAQKMGAALEPARLIECSRRYTAVTEFIRTLDPSLKLDLYDDKFSALFFRNWERLE